MNVLYEEMKKEFDDFQKWLERKPTFIALLYAYEYCLMKGFLKSLEENVLSEFQAEALLSVRKPLRHVVQAYEISGLDDIDKLFACLESCADTLIGRMAND